MIFVGVTERRDLIFFMEFLCRDLREFGVELIPPSAPEYDALLADIRWRVDDPVDGSSPIPAWMRGRIDDEDRETSAILVNRSRLGIAAVQQVWSFRESDGRTHTHSTGTGANNPSILHPYGIPEKALTLRGYWDVILPGSKRYLSRNGRLLGDNSDVRPPAGDEVWIGGGIGGGGGGGRRSGGQIESVTLTLDGVFFTDGGFVGPNQARLWEQVVARAEAHEQLTRVAKEGRDRGDAPGKILADIETFTGPAPPNRMPMPVHSRSVAGMDEFRRMDLQKLAWQIAMARQRGDEIALQLIVGWGDVRAPEFRKLG
jgi:hypothetical protein